MYIYYSSGRLEHGMDPHNYIRALPPLNLHDKRKLHNYNYSSRLTMCMCRFFAQKGGHVLKRLKGWLTYFKEIMIDSEATRNVTYQT